MMITWTDSSVTVPITSTDPMRAAASELRRRGHDPRLFQGGCGRWATDCRRCGAPAILTAVDGVVTLSGLALKVGCDREQVREIAKARARESR